MTDLTRRSFAFKAEHVAEDGTFTGYGSVFNVVDSYGDIVMPGAFAATLAAHAAAKSMPALLWQHDPNEPIGVWVEMHEDATGLWVKGRLLTEVARAREALALLRAGALSGLSIGFDNVESERQDGAGQNLRMISGLDLWEVSVVTFPACAPARVETVKRVAPPLAPRARHAPSAEHVRDPQLAAIEAALARRGRALSFT